MVTATHMTVIDAETIQFQDQDFDGRPIILPRRARGTEANDTALALSQFGEVQKFEYYGDVVVVLLGECGWRVRPSGLGVELLTGDQCVCTIPFACDHIRFSN